MNIPDKVELQHMQLQAILRDNSIPNSELMYLGEREYSNEYQAHPEYHGQLMHWYLVAGEHEVPVCDILSVDSLD
tara:strand:+ start:830 stop:1054 length:225 start_codon:yes stop_codon:yes gene_type:complete